MSEVRVADQLIGPDAPPFIVAEMSGNHNGDLGRALSIVDAIADSGAHAVKIQTYTADTLTIDSDRPEFRVQDDHGLWGGRTLHDLYREAYTPWDWHAPIFERARERGLVAFSTPFDQTAIDLLESLDVPLYKTASAEIVDLPLIRAIARTGKPILMSTGMATMREIAAAVEAAQEAGCTDLVVLACTAAYPARASEARLANIEALRQAFGLDIGLSDHTPGIGVAVAAVAHGAVAVEKHVTLAREDGGVDSDFSLEPAELRLLVDETYAAWEAMRGGTRFGPTPDEMAVLRLRRSLWVVEDVAAGDPVTEANVRSIRPAGGLPADAISTALGRTFRSDVSRGTPFTWDLV